MSDNGVTGKDLYLAFAGTVLDTNYRAFNTAEGIGTVDQSAGSDSAETHLTTLENGDASTTIKVKSGDTAIKNDLSVGNEGSLEWAWEGTAAGKPRHYVNAIVTGYTPSGSYNDLVTVDVSWLFSGDVSDGTY